MSRSRVSYSPSFKAKVVLASLKQDQTISQVASHFKVHPQVITKWRRQFLTNIETVFHDGRQKKPHEEIDIEGLYSKIGRLEISGTETQNQQNLHRHHRRRFGTNGISCRSNRSDLAIIGGSGSGVAGIVSGKTFGSD
jgi:transposase-like protein